MIVQYHAATSGSRRPILRFSLRVSKSSFLWSVIKVIIYAVVYWYGHLHSFSLRVGRKRDP